MFNCRRDHQIQFLYRKLMAKMKYLDNKISYWINITQQIVEQRRLPGFQRSVERISIRSPKSMDMYLFCICKEKYCQLRDLVKFSGRFDEFHIQCIGCSKSTHLLYNCPMLSGFPSRTKTLIKHKKRFCQERRLIQRNNNYKRISTLSFESKIADSVLFFLLRDPKMYEQLSTQINRTTPINQNGVRPKSKKKLSIQPKRGVPIFLSQEFSRSLEANYERSLGIQFSKEQQSQIKRITNFDQELTKEDSFKISKGLNKQFITKSTQSMTRLKSQDAIEENEDEVETLEVNPIWIERQNQNENMGRYKDIFEGFDLQRDYDSYMPHMNFREIQNHFQRNNDQDSFHDFIDANIVRRKWKKSKIVIVLES